MFSVDWTYSDHRCDHISVMFRNIRGLDADRLGFSLVVTFGWDYWVMPRV